MVLTAGVLVAIAGVFLVLYMMRRTERLRSGQK